MKILQEIPLDPEIKETKLIDGFLGGLPTVNSAKGINLPNVGFYDAATNSYKSGVGNPDVITDESIRRVSIDLGDGKTRYFQQIDHLDGTLRTSDSKHYSDNGLKVTAWQEIDKNGEIIKVNGKQEIRLNFTGVIGGGDIGVLIFDFKDGKLNPQAIDAAKFTSRVIKQVGKENISSFIYGSHSMGASNAIAAHIVSTLEDIPTKTILQIEPVGASFQINKITGAMSNENSQLFKTLLALNPETTPEKIKNYSTALKHNIDEQAISVRAITKDETGKFRGSEMASVIPGLGNIKGDFVIPLLGSIRGWYNWVAESFNPALGESHPNNRMLGKSYLQEIKNSCKIPTTSPFGKLDPTHSLATTVNCARTEKTYEVVDTNKISPPPLPIAQPAAFTRISY